MAWHIEALARQKVLPSLSSLMGIAPKAQSEDEMAEALSQWVVMHNAKIEMQEKLGVN